MIERDLRLSTIKLCQQLPFFDVLAGLYVHVRERAARLEVDVEIRAWLKTASAGDCRLHDPLLSGDGLLARPRRACRWRPELEHADCDYDRRDDADTVQRPRPRPPRTHQSAPGSGPSVASACDPTSARRWAAESASIG